MCSCFVFLHFPSTFTYPNPYPKHMGGHILLVRILIALTSGREHNIILLLHRSRRGTHVRFLSQSPKDILHRRGDQAVDCERAYSHVSSICVTKCYILNVSQLQSFPGKQSAGSPCPITISDINKKREEQTDSPQSCPISLHPSVKPLKQVLSLARLLLLHKKVHLRHLVIVSSGALGKIVPRNILQSSNEQLIQARRFPAVHETESRLC